MQYYLRNTDTNVTNEEKKHLFQLRTRMQWGIKTNFPNFYNDVKCIACKKEVCTQKHIMECPNISDYGQMVEITQKYENIFNGNFEEQIQTTRIIKEKLQKRKHKYGE